MKATYAMLSQMSTEVAVTFFHNLMPILAKKTIVVITSMAYIVP